MASNRWKSVVKKIKSLNYFNTVITRAKSDLENENFSLRTNIENRINVLEEYLNNNDELLCYTNSIVINNRDNKYFVIKYGPPASGKGTMIKNIISDLNISNYIDINVDSYVQYLIEKDKLEFNETNYNLKRKIADNISDNIFINCIINNNHILWETTGRNTFYTENVYIPFTKKYNYNIVLTIPIVILKSIIERCEKRTAQIANCTEDYLRDIKEKSSANFPALAKKCDLILIYDNNKSYPQLIFKYEPKINKIKCNIQDLSDEYNMDELIEPIKNFLNEICNPIKYKKS